MTVTEVYAELDRLNAAWERIEERLAGLPCELPGQRLTISRYAGRMRLCFNGKPLHDCKVDEKIEAFEHFPILVATVEGATEERGRKAKAVADNLERWLAGSKS